MFFIVYSLQKTAEATTLEAESNSFGTDKKQMTPDKVPYTISFLEDSV